MSNTTQSPNIYLPSVLAVLLILLVTWLAWLNMPQQRIGAGPEALAGGVAEDTSATGEEAAAPAVPEVDIDAAIAAANKGGCAACHVIPGIPNAQGQVGPNLSNIGVDAATRREGYTAQEYIRESLVEPAAFTAPDCPTGPCITGAMPILQLTDEEVGALVGYLSTLGN